MKTMKKLLLLFITTSLFISCSSNDIEDIDDSLLEGVWEFSSLDIDGITQAENECTSIETITISTTTQTAIWYTPYNTSSPCEPLTFNFKYTINGNTISLKDPDVSGLNVLVDEFSNKILVIKANNWKTTFTKFETESN
ncbi:lipocalin family protein [Bacteroidota bacterium]